MISGQKAGLFIAPNDFPASTPCSADCRLVRDASTPFYYLRPLSIECLKEMPSRRASVSHPNVASVHSLITVR